MDCTCNSRIGQQLTDQLLDKGAIEPRVFASFVGINLETGDSAITLPFIAHADNKPWATLKGQTLSVVASFCPFCGKPAKAAQTDKPAAEAAC